MITRVWTGWTDRKDADAYEAMLKMEIFPGIVAKGIEGLKRIELLRRPAGDEVEFMVIIRVTDDASLRTLTGGAPDKAYVPDIARSVLKRFETTARHFETYGFNVDDGQIRHV